MAALDRDCRKRDISSCSKERRRRGTAGEGWIGTVPPIGRLSLSVPEREMSEKARGENGKNWTGSQSGGTPCANERLLQKVVAQPKEKV